MIANSQDRRQRSAPPGSEVPPAAATVQPASPTGSDPPPPPAGLRSGKISIRSVHVNKRIGHAAMETASVNRRIRQQHVLGHRQHCGNFRLFGSALHTARPNRVCPMQSAAASVGGVSQGHGRASSLLIPSCRPAQALAASQAWRSAMPSKSNRASARASSLSSGRLRITLSCSALRGPQRRLSRRRVTLASPWT